MDVHSATCVQAFAVASLNPVERATALGGAVAGAPLRLVGGLAAPGPRRHGAQRAARHRHQGGAGADRQRPRRGLSAARRHGAAGPRRPGRHADRWRQRAAAPDPAPARHGRAWRSTPATRRTRWAGCAGRRPSSARRPSARSTEAEAAIAQVHRVHRRVKGIAPDGRPYSAADPELVTFIHVAEVASFLASSQRYGTRPLTPEECDRYYEEVAPVALALGATWAPRSVGRGGELPPAAAARALRGPAGQGGPGLAAAGRGPAAERPRRLLPRGGRRRRRPAGLGPPGARAVGRRTRSTSWSTPPP